MFDDLPDMSAVAMPVSIRVGLMDPVELGTIEAGKSASEVYQSLGDLLSVVSQTLLDGVEKEPRQGGHPYTPFLGTDATNFIQWKGTNVCMDFYCSCGAHGHVDDDFAYNILCPECGSYYELGTQVKALKVDSPTGAFVEMEVG